MNDNLKIYLDKLIEVGIILAFTYFFNIILDKLIDKIISRRKDKNLHTVLLFFKRLKKYVIYIIGVIVCLSKFEVFNTLSVTILSGIGIFTTVMGLAAKDTLTDFFGSLALVFAGPFQVGDYIDCIDKKISGTVEEISMHHTIIRTVNNQKVIVPNSVMNTLAIQNYNRGDSQLCLFAEYPISYETDIDKAVDILKEEVGKLYKPNKKDVEFPKIRVISWQNSSILLRAWVWGKDSGEAYENLYHLNYVIKKRFQEEKIEIPYDKLDVNLKK